MDVFGAIFLAIVQGLTEFLPVSSTAHLILIEKLFHLSPEKFGLSFDVALHLGTLLSLVVLFGKDFGRLLTAFFRSLLKRKIGADEEKLAWFLLVATIPAAIFGFFLESKIENNFRDPILIVMALVFGSLIFWLAEKAARQNQNAHDLGFRKSLILGLAQSLALIPGISRSGITISGGLFLGLKRDQAGYFVFLLSAPIIFGAGLKKMIEIARTGVLVNEIGLFLLGFVVSAVVGYVCVFYFLRFLKEHTLLVFIYYRLLLAILVLGLLFVGRL